MIGIFHPETATVQDITFGGERKVQITFYRHKKDPVPNTVRSLSVREFFEFLAKRTISEDKDGAGFGQYQLKASTSRANENVVARSGIDIDIDSGATLDDLRPALSQYLWAAYSTHSHNPDAGAIKFRIALPFSRDVTPDEWAQVWAGCNSMLGGVMDKSTKDVCRMVYTPRCPEATQHHAFFEQHEGALIDPDTLIALAPPPNHASKTIAINNDLSSGMNTSAAPDETPAEIERVRSMLKVIPADSNRDVWLGVLWAVASTGWSCAEKLAREWSKTAPDKFNEHDFIRDWTSFDPERGIGYGTLSHHAKLHGWMEGVHADERFTGSGGDVANGRIFASVWRGRLIFIHETNDVLLFDDRAGWISAPPGEADRAAKDVLAKLREKAAEHYKNASDDPKTKRIMAHVERTSKAPNLRAMIDMSKSETGMTCNLSEFDDNPMHLGVANGVLDLRTGTLLPVSPALLVSKRCPVEYVPGAECPIFLDYLRTSQPKQALREFMQRFAGYCLTGMTQEQKLAFLYGHGANGKSVFVELIAWLMGDYARKIHTEMLMQHQRSPQGPSPDIVALKGRRFIYANETEEGKRLAESRVKDMTGGDTLTGRVPYGKADITFQPTHKLIIVGNHRPEIMDMSNGMWRRMMLVPFDVTIPVDERDPRLPEKLKAEGAGILNWALEGLRQWQQQGLMVPVEIEAATAAYRDDMDIVGEWIAEHCEAGTGREVTKLDAYKAYHTWAQSNGHHPTSKGKLTRRLGDRGFAQRPDKRAIGGLSLNEDGKRATMHARI